MTKQEYLDYQERVEKFFSHGLCNLSTLESCNEPFFSWHPCECCGTHLGGDRYECNGYNEVTREIEEYTFICGDCVYYAEHGQLDDQTMLEIEKESQ